MEKIDKGIVLSKQEYKEFDQLISVLFAKSGLKTLIALGTLKAKSKNAINIEVGNHSEFAFFHARLDNVSKLKKALCIESFLANKTNVNKFAVMTYILEVSKNILQENWEINTTKWYLFLLEILNLIQKDNLLSLIKFCQFALEEMGIKTINDACGKCGNKKYIAYINHTHHGLVCYLCDNKAYSKDLVLDFIKVTNWDLKEKLNIANHNKIIIANFYIEWIDSFVLVSKKILKSLKLIKS